jgi:hypothetical protein
VNFLRNLRHRLAHWTGCNWASYLGSDDTGIYTICEGCGTVSRLCSRKKKQVDIYVIMTEDSRSDAD